jgi:hypothetical protein
MEPFHQIRFTDAQIPDWRSELRKEGFSIIESKQSWLGDRFPEFSDVICERDGRRMKFASASAVGERSENVFVYPNIIAHTVAPTIRTLFERFGAKWSYFSDDGTG